VVADDFVSVTELGAAEDELETSEGEEVEVTVGDVELRDELLDGASEVMGEPSDVEQPANRTTAAPIMSNPNGLDSPLSVMRDPLPAPRPAITRQQANASGPQIHIPASLPLGCY
jgi:hypothetical protein